MVLQYKPQGVCSTNIEVDVEDGIVRHVQFTGGCHGNTQGVSRLVEGMSAKDAIAKLAGIQCGRKGTSCPDQLSKALTKALEEQ